MARAKEEQVFFQQEHIKVTNTRFIVGSHTYAMSGVTSVKTAVEMPSRKGALICIATGVLCCLPGNVRNVVAGLVVVGVGILWWVLKKPTFHILLHSASGEHRGLSDQDRNHIDLVVKALNEAIVARG